MPFYRVMIRVGHWGVKKEKYNVFYTRANNLLEAYDIIRTMPTVHHDKEIPYSAYEISEDEYVINACINAYDRHYDAKFNARAIEQIKERVLGDVEKERSLNPNNKQGKIADQLSKLVRNCEYAKNAEKQRMAINKLNKFVEYNYFNIDDILKETDAEMKEV